MIRLQYMLVRYWLQPTTKRWRAIRTLLMSWLPPAEKKADIEAQP